MISKNKVLFLTFWYPSKINPIFGIFTREHAKAIHKSGVEVEILAYLFNYSSHIYKKEVNTFVEEGIRTHLVIIHSFLYRFIQINPWHNVFILKKVLKKVKNDFDFELIHANVVSPCGVVARFLAKYFNVPYIITEHWTRIDRYFKNNKISFLGKLAYNEAAAVTTVSEDLKKIVSKYMPSNESKITVVPNVVDSQTFTFHQKSTGNADLKFVTICNLKRPKLPDLVIRALEIFAHVHKKKVTWKLFGSGELEHEVKKGIRNVQVEIIPKADKELLVNALHESDALIHATENETFCLVIAEALSTGTPVLGSKLDVLEELVTEKCGILVENDVEKFAEALPKLFTSKWDGLEISKNNQGKFDYQAVGKQFKQIYQNILFKT